LIPPLTGKIEYQKPEVEPEVEKSMELAQAAARRKNCRQSRRGDPLLYTIF